MEKAAKGAVCRSFFPNLMQRLKAFFISVPQNPVHVGEDLLVVEPVMLQQLYKLNQ
jgi:hypothetical protein